MAEVKVYEGAAHDEAHEEHHGGSFALYWIIAAILGAATLLEVWLAEFLKGRISSAAIATLMMAIALFKAIQVILFYMHLKYEKAVLWLIFGIPFVLVSLLLLTLFTQPGG